MLIDFLERRRGRETYRLPPVCAPTGDRTRDPSVHRRHPNQLDHVARAVHLFRIIRIFIWYVTQLGQK